MVIFMSPVFSMVTFWVLVLFSVRLPKLIEAGVKTRSAKAFSPDPVKATLSETVWILLAIWSVPDALPEAVGANVIV